MSEADPSESALIIACPEAEAAVDRQRQRLDGAARLGVPAHITVTYPFKPATMMTAADDDALQTVIGAFDGFAVRGAETGWFDESVLFVRLDEPEVVAALTDAVGQTFPAWPPYGGVFDEVVPHLTVGHDQPRDVLVAAEREVRERLPFVQTVDHIELWAGPAFEGAGIGEWRWVRDYRLG